MLSLGELWAETRVAARMIRMNPEQRRAFESLELRVRAILPEEYQDCYDEVEPVSMGSASLKFGRDGKVAWQDMWVTFCDLAMAGGPPHKGRLLLPGSRTEVEADPDRYQHAVHEICRGITMLTELPAAASPVPGWIRVECATATTAAWLARAIVMENVSARCEGTNLYLPAGPAYRIEKEIKNVITAMAKTCHYWLDHTPAAQQRQIEDLFGAIAAESPLIQPAAAGFDVLPDNGPVDIGPANIDPQVRNQMASNIQAATGLVASEISCDGWFGVVCPDMKAAIWMMRAMVVSNVLARREDTTLFVAVNPVTDPGGEIVTRILTRVHGFARVRDIL